MPMGKGRLPAAICALLVLALAGAGKESLIPGLPPLEAVSAAESQTVGTDGLNLALEAEDEGASTPFGELPDMKKMTEAMEIIGDTPLDNLSDTQLQKLKDIGVDLETLKENESLLSEVRDNLPEQGEIPWPAIAGAAAVGGTGCAVWAYVLHRRKKRPK